MQFEEVVAKPVTRYRSTVERGIAIVPQGNIARNAGLNDAGLIRRFAVISRAEALGHGYWIDSVMLSQVADAINANDKGVKVRFTHPDMSGDGLGTLLGRARNATVSGDVVYADLHFSGSAHHAPDGNLAEYVMTLAEEDHDAFGASIAFMLNMDAINDFAVAHGATLTAGGIVDFETFDSPDPLNGANLPHVRLAELHAVDIVDSPAANPNGMFHRGDNIAAQAEAMLSYSLGLSATRPTVAAFDIDPDRMAGFVARFLHRNGLSITKDQEGLSMSEDTKTTAPETTPEAIVDPKAEFAAQRELFVKHFGAVDGSEYLAEGLAFADALEFHAAKLTDAVGELKDQLKAKDEEIAALNERFNSLALGEEEPTEFSSTEGGSKTNAALGLTAAQQAFAASLKAPTLN